MKHFLFAGMMVLWSAGSFGQFTNSRWITVSDKPGEPNQWLCFRKSFQLIDMPSGNVTARIAADSKYWCWINNQLVVFEGGLKRGPNPSDTYYDEVEIGKYLKRGNNTLAILVWFFGKEGFSHKNSGKAGLLVEAMVGKQAIVSDGTWKVMRHPSYGETGDPRPNFRLPESNIGFDARKDQIRGWESSAFTDKSWPGAIETGVPPCAPWNKLVLRPVPQWKNLGLKEYVNKKMLPGEAGSTIMEGVLPKNITITPYFKIEAPEGLTIDVRTDNYKGGGENNIRTEYITRKGVQEFEGLAYMNGHQVLYSFPAGIKIISLKYRETRFNTEYTGYFSCNDPLLNKLYEKAVNTLNLNIRDQISDCPDRERAQWWGDVVITLGEMLYTCDTNGYAAIKKAIMNLVDWQKEDGSLYAPVPAGNWDRELPPQMLASISEFGIWRYYQYTGDSAILQYVYPHVKKYLSLWRVGFHGTVEHRSGGWDWADWGKEVDFGVLDNAWYYLALESASRMAEVLRLSSDVEYYRHTRKIVKDHFNRIYWTGTEYRSPMLTVTDDRANGLAVVSGLADAQKWPAIRRVIESQTFASPYMEKYILESCFRMNMNDFAIQRMKNRYQKMVESPLTTLWEGWDINSPEFGGGTYNHGWTGGPLTLMMEYMAGIGPDEPGYTAYHVLPRLGGLTTVNCKTPTVRGAIEVSISSSTRRFSLKIEGPPKTPVIMGVPVNNYQNIYVNKVKVWENGQPVPNSIVSFSENDGIFYRFQVKSVTKIELVALISGQK